MTHMTVADNIALVPGLLNWDKQRIRERVDELLQMTGLDPEIYRDRYPRELSGGQQQRVGVARGLAADPPVVLMDEPFGAVDPITRQRLQDELLSIQEELRKTIVFVTHDIDEAIKLGDRVLILQEGGKVAQYDTPENILGAPASDFVADFIGAGSRLKQLSLLRVSDLELSQPATCHTGEPVDEVLQRVQDAGERSVIILDAKDRPRDWLFLRSLHGHQTVPVQNKELPTVIDQRSTLTDALDSMLYSSHGGAMVTRRARYTGVVSYDAVTEHLRTSQEEQEEKASGSVWPVHRGKTAYCSSACRYLPSSCWPAGSSGANWLNLMTLRHASSPGKILVPSPGSTYSLWWCRPSSWWQRPSPRAFCSPGAAQGSSIPLCSG